MLSFIQLSFLLFQISLAQDIFFPDGQTTTNITISLQCPINMSVQVFDGETVCECTVGYLYYPAEDRCFKPYQQGPCKSNEFLVLPTNETIAKCVVNPCGGGFVPYKNNCYELLRTGPCADGQTLIVNEYNFKISCQEVRPVVYQIIVAPSVRCPSGSRRIARGQCRPSL